VHSGPVSAIRFVGYVGLLLFLILQVLIVRFAWQLVRRAQGTGFSLLSLYIGLPVIWELGHFVLIFGAYEHALPEAIFAVGMLKMLQNSMDQPAAETETRPAVARRADEYPALAASRVGSVLRSRR
jgi:hypothetical protein